MPAKTHDQIEQLLNDCEERESMLTDWERGFIDSLMNKIDARGLTEKEVNKLGEVWERVTSAQPGGRRR